MSDAVIITEAENRQVIEADAGTQVVEQVLNVGGGGSGTDQTARDAAAAAQATANAALPKAGGTMTGKITLDGDPSSALHAAPKQYVDTKQDAATAATDAELTAHASDTTAVHGIADTAALALSANVQPLDSDLTAIAALSTTAYGRSLLELADAAAGRTSLGLGSAATHAHSDYLAASSAPVVPWANWRPFGAKIESIPRPLVTGGGHSMSSGRILLAACSEPLRAGVTYSWLKFLYSTAPTSPTHQWACLIDGSTMKVLRSSTDLTTTAITSSTYATFTLSSAYTPASDIAKPYVGLLITASSLSGLLFGDAASAALVSSGLSESDLFGWGASGLTTPLADGASAGTVGTGFSFFPYYLIG